MKRLEATTLEEAYLLASSEFNCSITNLEIEVVQNSRKGFLGLGKKNAIIVATQKHVEVQKSVVEPVRKKVEPKSEPKIEKKPQKEFSKPVAKKQTENRVSKPQKKLKTTDIFDNFYAEKQSSDEIAIEIENELKRLFSFGCFKIDTIRVTKEDKNTLLIEFDGDDAALLIGKEGYRYKALSYMLFNWINPRYNLMVKLEIAQFLKNQEEMIKNYLIPIIDNIKMNGYGQTKPLDGVLSHIALKQLREAFPNKYVVTREADDGVKYVIVTDFKK